METMINKYLKKTGQEDILKAINDISVDGCIESYCNYITDEIKDDDMSSFEKQFRHYLKNNIESFLISITKATFNTKSKDELFDMLVEVYTNGIWSINNSLDGSEDYEYYINNITTDKDFYPLLHNYLLEVYDEISKKIELDTYDTKIQELENSIKSNQYYIDERLKAIKTYQQEIAKITKYKQNVEKKDNI